jgi:hypothetical protein
MLVSVVGSRREGAINSNLVHLACVPVRRASTERKGDQPEGSLEQDDSRLQATPQSGISPDTGSISARDVTENAPSGVPRMNMTAEVSMDSVRSGMLFLVKLTLKS